MAKRSFSMVTRTIWRSKRFRALDDSMRLLMFYFITSPHQNSIGCFTLPVEYACADLGWPQEVYESARDGLSDCGLITVSEDGETIFISDWFTHCPPSNRNHAVGLERQIEDIPDEAVKETAFMAYSEAVLDGQNENKFRPSGSNVSHLNNTSFMRGRA